MRHVYGPNSESYYIEDNGDVRTSTGFNGRLNGNIVYMDDGRSFYDYNNGFLTSTKPKPSPTATADIQFSDHEAISILKVGGSLLAIYLAVNVGMDHYERSQISPVIEETYSKLHIEEPRTEFQQCLHGAAKKAFGKINNLQNFKKPFERREEIFNSALQENIDKCGEVDYFKILPKDLYLRNVTGSFYIAEQNGRIELSNSSLSP